MRESRFDPDRRLRWLHLTDLHFGSANEAQQTAVAALVKAIGDASKGVPFDLVILTGDLSYSGKKSEYDQLEQRLLHPLRELGVCAEAIVIAVPGNHDLDCDSGYPPVWNSLGSSRQATFFNLDEVGKKTRSSRATSFTAYSDFLRSSNVVSVDPVIEPAYAHNFSIRDQKIVVISAVTAYFSDKEVPDYRKCPAPVHPIRHLLQSVDPATTKIVLGHHPLTWFTEESERHLRSLLVEQNALYFNGHEHQVTSAFSGRGLLQIGFGAAYVTRLEAPPKPYYRNSFAICELSDFLHVQITSWDLEHGLWRFEQNLPSDFLDRSELLESGYRFSLPFTRLTNNSGRPLATLAASVKVNFQFDACIWLARNAPRRWAELLEQMGYFRVVVENYTLTTQAGAAGHHQFRVKDQRGQYLVYVITGSGDILNYEQLKSINTELDKQAYDGCLIATLGGLSDEAKTLATQLKSRKSITLLERQDLIRNLLRLLTVSQRRTLTSLDSTEIAASLVILDADISVLLHERSSTAWFNVTNGQGASFPESDNVVLQVRQELPQYRTTRYRILDTLQQELPMPVDVSKTFDSQQYLDACYAHFDDVKYAPLAALGFRFRKASLSELYVDASADASGTSKNTQSINRAISEFIETLSLPKSQRDQLDSQMRSRLGIERTAEVGAARQLYQRFNNVLVLGDPGSGKTCFVKHEILAYSKPPPEGGSWYANHIPVYVSLAEAARLIDGKTTLLEMCEILSARRGIALPKGEILNLLSRGGVAFFFDGLDEVGFMDRRILLMAEIDSLVKIHAQHGNRFVIASRPAAIRPIAIPAGLTYLHLKGLTEEEMRLLASRVLTVRLGEHEQKELTSDETELVEKLLEDTRNNPGIARIARNPLLLTLLVLIYANTGALSTKRHLIYTQAIKTLVSVRGRETRAQQLSEADLRTRLGAIAVAVFSREIAEIPKRAEVLRVLGQLPRSSPAGAAAPIDEFGNAFLQEVAEATGLLSIHGVDSDASEDLITFMHYSFLEYYAAAGLLSRNYLESVPTLAVNPRWKDVITLLFGILSEHSDVTPALKAVLTQQDNVEHVTLQRLLLCLDCAAECDVPPIATQDLLARAMHVTLADGAGRFSGKVRGAIAGRLGHFSQGAAAEFERAIVEGLRNGDSLRAAAFADLVARLPSDFGLSALICSALEHLSRDMNPVATAAIMSVVEVRPELRTEAVIPAIQRALTGSLVEKHAALKVLAVNPAYHNSCSAQVSQLLDDPNDFIASTAARCLLSGASGSARWKQNLEWQEKLLAKLSFSEDDSDLLLSGITLDRLQIETMISSDKKSECELAIRYLPLIRQDTSFVYETLMKQLKHSHEPRHKAASLDSLRTSPGAIDLITIADTDLICSLLETDERNVRLAATRLLGVMPDDEQVIRTLQSRLMELQKDSTRDLEIMMTAKALARHARQSEKLRASVQKTVYEYFPSTAEAGFGDAVNQQHLLGLLTVCEAVGEEANDRLAQRLLGIGESFRTPEAIRRQCLRVFGRLAAPTLSNLDTLLRLLGRNDPRMNEATYASVLSFLGQCRRRADSMRQVFPGLGRLRDKLLIVWKRETPDNAESIDGSAGRDIRDSIIELEELSAQYAEFSERARPAAALS